MQGTHAARENAKASQEICAASAKLFSQVIAKERHPIRSRHDLTRLASCDGASIQEGQDAMDCNRLSTFRDAGSEGRKDGMRPAEYDRGINDQRARKSLEGTSCSPFRHAVVPPPV